MKKILILPIFAVLIITVFSYNAYAATSFSGAATKCTGLASCSYTLSSNTGNGLVTTSASVGGYVGQSPLLFSGGSVNFQLPGETTVTYATNVFSGKSVLVGTSITAGTLYNVTGKFSATDVNTGKIVNGSTNDIVGIKSKSGRGGGNTYTLVSGSITILQTDTVAKPPSPPQNLKATAGDDSIVLSWSPPASTSGASILDYKIYKSTSSGTETYYALRGNVLSYIDTSVTPGITYFYKVSAVTSNGESSLSKEVSACLC